MSGTESTAVQQPQAPAAPTKVSPLDPLPNPSEPHLAGTVCIFGMLTHSGLFIVLYDDNRRI